MAPIAYVRVNEGTEQPKFDTLLAFTPTGQPLPLDFNTKTFASAYAQDEIFLGKGS